MASLRSPEKIEKFKAWLCERGAEVLTPTNEYELLRFRSIKGTSIVYRDKRGNNTMTNEAGRAFEAWSKGEAWRAYPYSPRDRVTPMVAALLLRDGDLCFYCLEKLLDNITVEHLVARTHNGPDHISNLFLAHDICNREAGHLSVVEKIQRHVAAHLEKAQYANNR